jgi:hypothetical protein
MQEIIDFLPQRLTDLLARPRGPHDRIARRWRARSTSNPAAPAPPPRGTAS